MIQPDPIEQAASVVASAKVIVALTGAGVSQESGLPTFRDAQTGYWEKFKPEELATPEAFTRKPQLVWSWYFHRLRLVLASSPNVGHKALVDLAAAVSPTHI